MLQKLKKIRTKILLPTLLVFCISLSITAAVSGFLSHKSTLNTLDRTMRETIDVASGRITAELNSYKTLLTELAGTVDYLEADQVMGFLEHSQERNGFENVSITTPEGIVGGTNDSVAAYEFFKVPRDQHIPYISEPLLNADGQSMSIYIAAPVMIGDRFDGIIFTGLNAKLLSDIVSDISVGETGTTAIIDKTGTTIAYHDYSIVLSGYRTQDEEKTDPQLASLAALERDVMAGNSGFDAYQYDGTAKFMAYAPVEGTNQWGMYVSVTQSEFMRDTYTSIFICVGITILSLLVACIVLIWLAGSISHPIVAVSHAATEMAQGNFDVVITHQSCDEIGSLAESMRQMTSVTKGIIVDTARGLAAIAVGDFDIAPRVKYIGVFQGIEASMFKIVQDLSDTMAQIKMSADQVAGGSEQVATGSQALAEGAAQQASAVQELSASINEISEQIKASAANAASASNVVDRVGNTIRTSNEQMTEMMDAMHEISASSSQISKIIKTIEDIAFQTNILALNAAVEAARAGQAGKGFAVVADEVRSLATKSSEAAKQTNGLIEGSVHSVEHGVKIANATAASLTEVVSGAKEITELITKISHAAAEQSTSISQIDLGVEQISSVVQTNSATSEQSAAASEELNSQAGRMQQLVKKFRLNTGMADSGGILTDHDPINQTEQRTAAHRSIG